MTLDVLEEIIRPGTLFSVEGNCKVAAIHCIF